MPEDVVKKSNLFLKENISNSNIIRVVGVLILFAIYSLTISPHIEDFLTSEISTKVQATSKEEINTLTPIFDINVYAGEYNLSSTLENSSSTSRTKFFTIDPRVLAMSKFLTDYQSPMAKYAETFVVEADKHGLDWRIIASISGVESAFGNLMPKGSHNGWGWRGINGNEAGWSVFATWDDAISHITERIAVGYGTSLTPYDIQDTYCPPCGATGENLWAKGVTRFMNELEYYVNNLENL